MEEVLSTKKVKYFQLRLKQYPHLKVLSIGKKIKKITKNYGVKLIINDSAVLAKKINADGCHLGQSDGSIKAAKKLLGKKKNSWYNLSWLKEINIKSCQRKN